MLRGYTMKRYKKLSVDYLFYRKKVENYEPRTSYGEFFSLYTELQCAKNRKKISEYEYDFLCNILIAKMKGKRK